jgi:hypothetical protein
LIGIVFFKLPVGGLFSCVTGTSEYSNPIVSDLLALVGLLVLIVNSYLDLKAAQAVVIGEQGMLFANVPGTIVTPGS